MKRSRQTIRQYYFWFLTLAVVDGFAALLLWIADVQAFRAMVIVILLFSVLLFLGVYLLQSSLEKKREQAFLSFLGSPDELHEEILLQTVDKAQKNAVCLLGETLRKKQTEYDLLQMQLNDYEEYVETWAHEAKIPLSLLTLLLDNRRDELPEAVVVKLDYIRNKMQEDVEQMLFYARLKGSRKDYLFENTNIRQCIEDVLEDYKPLLEERDFRVYIGMSEENVFTDRRGIRFLLSQIISNTIKYCGKEPELHFEFISGEKVSLLKIRDNGIGVRSCDLPYIFEKGFTGDSGDDRKKATGMGLYLAKEMADALKLSLEAKSEWGFGFEMQISFPIVDSEL